MLPETAVDFDLTDTIFKLSFQVLVPVILGLFFHKYLVKFVNKFQVTLKNIDQAIILLIIFTAFAESFLANMFDGHSVAELVLLGVLMLVFFLLMMGVMYLLSKALKFSREDMITVIFCGSKKSMIQGAVMGRVMFPDPVVFGVMLLPLMIYHAQQLMVGSTIAQKLGDVKSSGQ